MNYFLIHQNPLPRCSKAFVGEGRPFPVGKSLTCRSSSICKQPEVTWLQKVTNEMTTESDDADTEFDYDAVVIGGHQLAFR